MRNMQGLVCAGAGFSEERLKRLALLFDSVTTVNLDHYLGALTTRGDWQSVASLEYLEKVEFLKRPPAPWREEDILTTDFAAHSIARRDDGFDDWVVRSALELLTKDNPDLVPVWYKGWPELSGDVETARLPAVTLHVALSALPLPDDSCAWENIFDFKADLRDKHWGFRRFLQTVATKRQTEAEISDEVEWLVNEYSRAMNIHHIKSSQSFVDVFVISPLEIIENLAKLNLSKVLKGALSIKKREVELLEAEMKAPGRECAYVFDARERFGKRDRS